ncbi:hypothetical protein SARC_12252 [Sphaeroforma arctica JP610]|uniref:rRNA biogenesis protein RRP36 n=1 Tax=Sphaeroforma arctica JP610 TaxID=667725 RepID=A0A0L0FEM5_9EUKA|nr:hypothetical protein SARC_12252 [Sphaeroforma arctica JP610]KNC75217.1 hypothetical protein SARC_12252 [Sphaeroforma arctica JP610]|eukprot:XP_014149119.1 hypothetical protein SARC_12252 [Sphaeroforma arctica JP610]
MANESQQTRYTYIDTVDSSDEPEEINLEEEAVERLRTELDSMPFVELQALRDRIGMQKFKVLYASVAKPSTSDNNIDEASSHTSKIVTNLGGKAKKNLTDELNSSTKRTSKNAPREMSSKTTVTRLRKVVEVKNTKSRDPRFDDLSGAYNSDLWQKAYGFLDEYRAEELKELQAQFKKEKDAAKREEIQLTISKIKQSDELKRREKAKQELKAKFRKAEEAAVAKGKNPFYLKKTEQKKLEMVAKFNQLKEKGELDRYLEKRKKKNTSKDHRYVPYNRR